jgi:hypothetical protein
VDELRSLAAKAETDHASAQSLRSAAEKVHHAARAERARLKEAQKKLALAGEGVRSQSQRLARERLEIAQQRKELRETRSASPPVLRDALTPVVPATAPLSDASLATSNAAGSSSSSGGSSGSTTMVATRTDDGYSSIASRFRSFAFGEHVKVSAPPARRAGTLTPAKENGGANTSERDALASGRRSSKGGAARSRAPSSPTMSTADQLRELRDEQFANDAFLHEMYY